MRFNVQFQINDEKILVTSEQKNYYREYKNIIALDPNNKIAAIGQTLDELITEKPQYEDQLRRELRFEALYTEDKYGLEKLFVFIIYELSQIARGEMLLFRSFNLNSATCYLLLPNYEKIEKDTKKRFEYSLFNNGIREIYINNLLCGWSNFQLLTLRFSKFAISLFSFILWFIVVSSPEHFKEVESPILIMFVWLLSFAIPYYLLVFIRFFILRAFISHDLLRLELIEQGKGIEGFLNRLLQNLLDQ